MRDAIFAELDALIAGEPPDHQDMVDAFMGKTPWPRPSDAPRGRPVKHPLDPDIKALPCGKSYKLRLQRKRRGQCVECGKPRHPELTCRCAPCQEHIRELQRKRRGYKGRYVGAQSYVIGRE